MFLRGFRFRARRRDPAGDDGQGPGGAPLLTLDFMPEKGKTYDLKLVPDGEGTWKPVPFEAE